MTNEQLRHAGAGYELIVILHTYDFYARLAQMQDVAAHGS